MPKKIDPELKTILVYFQKMGKDKIIIPEYQRSYSWTTETCDKLWQDIEEFMESDIVGDSGEKEPYFFGTIIADCSTQGRISLIDGQQRTTTFILLMKALLLRIQKELKTITRDDETESLIDALEDRRNAIVDILYQTDSDNRRDILRNPEKMKGRCILESKSINESRDYKGDLCKIVGATDFDEAESQCYRIPRKQKDNKYTNFFRNFKYFYLKLKEYDSTRINKFAKTFLGECQVIEIRSWNTEQAIKMFNSLNSTGLPLSDADIISAQLYSKASADSTALNEFTEIWKTISSKARWLEAKKIVNIDSLLQQNMYIQRAEQKVYVREGSQPDVTTPGLRRYYTYDCKDILSQPMALCKRLKKLAEIWETVQDYPVVKLIVKFNENAKLYLISFLNRFEVNELTQEKILQITECLIRLFTVLELVDVGYSSSQFKTFLFGENVKLVDKSVTIDVIRHDFDEHISRCWKEEELKETLRDYEKNILVFLNEYLFAKKDRLSFDFSDSVNVEHIMPGSGRQKETIMSDAGIETREEFDFFVNQLGNKILLEEDINKSISNDWFRTKKQKTVTEKKGYKDSKYGIAQKLVNYDSDTWKKEDIAAATEKVASRIIRFIFGRE
ncbi:MAG: DUF262 domain-containing protein [Lentisphaeria bacterium]|nr:DUF262 domain-containing protein [Lentisphaeria bacterium]